MLWILSMASNPISIPISGDTSGAISCNADAGNHQRVTLNWMVSGDTVTVVFSGSGAGVPMHTAQGGSKYDLPPIQNAYHVHAYFEYSASGADGPFMPSRSVQAPIVSHEGGKTFVSVTSEDCSDGNSNDVCLTVFYQGS